tara:strand:+ start:2904 stop:4133 length:1230 start_codon:yes stop_codon:yes gene_type:complete
MPTEINALTPLDQIKKRKQSVQLLQAVMGCNDVDFMQAFVTVRDPQIPTFVNARREGIFDYGQLILETGAGNRWPSVPLVIAAIEKVEAGELTIESDEWKAIVEAIGIDDKTRTHNGTKVKSEHHLFHLVTQYDQLDDGGRKTKRYSAPKKGGATKTTKKKAPAKKTAPVKKAASKKAAPPKEEPVKSEQDDTAETGDLMAQLAGAFDALDTRIMERIDVLQKHVGEGVVHEVDSLRNDIDQSFSGMFRALQLVAKSVLVVYDRQEEAVLDPMGDWTELDDGDQEALRELIEFNVGESEGPPDEGQADEEVEQENQGSEDQKSEDANASEDDDEVIVLDEEIHGKMSDEDFDALIAKVTDMEIRDPEILDKISIGKLRSIGDRLGVPGAKTLNYRPLLKTKIIKALSPE